ncbi:MAG: hypothetical protein JWN43_2178 [Gammaproteobacteria bacterium]|nr:hypothetical protein [Gammaproteobacteria bacterium]
MIPRRALVAVTRMSLGLLAVAAIVRQLGIQVRLGYSVLNFFSYFTNLANVTAAGVLISSAGRLLAGTPATRSREAVRAASVMYMAVVGIVFGLLLRDVDLGSLLPWVNIVLHALMPSAVVMDWLLFPPRASLGIRDLLTWLIAPALYLMYVLIRGSEVGWYPYPFLNPGTAGGYAAVAAYSLGIALTFLLVGWMVVAIGKRLSAERAGFTD